MNTRLNKMMIGVAMATFLVVGCTVDPPSSVEVTARPTFSSYVAIGNSLTAGYQDGALHVNGQLNSFPAMIARKMGLHVALTSSEFTQPYLMHPGVGSPIDRGNPLSDLVGVSYWNGVTVAVSDTVTIAEVPALHVTAERSSAPYNNLGVPGAKLAESLQSREDGMFRIVLRNPDLGNGTSQSLVDWAATRNPSLITVWLGANDVLGAALYGDDPTDPTAFENSFEAMMDSLVTKATARTGIAPTVVAGNIPYISSMAYFIPSAVFDTIYPYGYVDTTAALVRIQALGWITDPANAGQPVPAPYTLGAATVTTLNTLVDAYNTAIETVCTDIGAGLVDLNTILQELSATGLEGLVSTHFLLLMQQDGMTVETAANMAAFSLDGVHPSPRGYALIANAFIDEINDLSNGAPLGHVAMGDISWDPTYGIPGDKAADPDTPPITDAVMDLMTGIFRR